jgi:hypothetical protein
LDRFDLFLIWNSVHNSTIFFRELEDNLGLQVDELISRQADISRWVEEFVRDQDAPGNGESGSTNDCNNPNHLLSESYDVEKNRVQSNSDYDPLEDNSPGKKDTCITNNRSPDYCAPSTHDHDSPSANVAVWCEMTHDESNAIPETLVQGIQEQNETGKFSFSIASFI